ncbi:MAG: family N-acetyltransferase [Acidimicrobiales bacterium]|nr:family N-acetyltransferase [Acidimicrobiales bacterium]
MTDPAGDDLTAPIDGDGVRLVLIPPAVLRAVDARPADQPAGPVDWPGTGPISAELARSMPAGLRLRQAEADPQVAAWLIRGLVVDDPASPTGLRVVGHVGGHDQPDARGTVEAGYTVAVAERRRGLATAGVRAWFAWARCHGATGARLSITEDNAASLAIAGRLGLVPTDRVWDEEDQVWERVFTGSLLGSHPA